MKGSLAQFFVLCACLSVGRSRGLLAVKRLGIPLSRLFSALPSGTPPTDPYNYARDTESPLATQFALGIATMKESNDEFEKSNKEAMEKNTDKMDLFTKEITVKMDDNTKATERALIISTVTLLGVATVQPDLRSLLIAIASKFVKV